MKTLSCILFSLLFATATFGNTAEDRASLLKTTAAIRDAFARGDVKAIVALHDPAIVKYFGGSNVVVGRENLETGLKEMFRNSTMEFVENQVESTLFHGDTAVETSIFAIRVSFRDGRPPVVSRGRAMVVYVKSKTSPTGWASIREMAQSAPEAK
jgi:ketosteroid isomerase-like protein